MRWGLVGIASFLVASCGGSSPPSSPPSSHPAQVSQSAAAWQMVYSLGSALQISPNAVFQFDFPATSPACPEPTETTTPTCPSVHYLETAAPALQQGQTVVMTGSIVASSDAVFNYAIDADNQTPGGHPAACRFFLQQAGDNLSGQGAFAYYRWWANDPADVVLANGSFSIAVQLTPNAGWTSVEGEQANASAAASIGFSKAIALAQNIGFTCGGGSFYGHGVNMAVGSATFILTSFLVQ